MTTARSLISSTAAQACGAVLRHMNARTDDAYSRFWDGIIRDIVYVEAEPQPIKKWLAEHDGQTVLTLQCTVDPMSQDVRSVWTPGNRTIEHKPTYARFIEPDLSWSERHYDGIRSVRTSESTYIGYDISNRTLIVYTVAS